MTAVWNNVLLAVVVPLVTVILSFALATMVTVGGASQGAVRGLRYSGFYRVISFFPYTVPAIIIGLIWAQMFDPSSGLLNGLLTGIGLDGFDSFPWLGDTRSAMPASMFVIVWGFVGFYMVLFVAAIKGIPSEYYDAARMDGAGQVPDRLVDHDPAHPRHGADRLHLPRDPGSRRVRLHGGAHPGGGPDNSTLVMPQRLLDTAFAKGQFGLASAMGVVMAIATLAFAAIVFAVNRFSGGHEKVG